MLEFNTTQCVNITARADNSIECTETLTVVKKMARPGNVTLTPDTISINIIDANGITILSLLLITTKYCCVLLNAYSSIDGRVGVGD